MVETIGIRLTELCSPLVNFNLSEAEVEAYPYAVYSSSPSPVYTKDGIHHYESDVTITVYAKDLDVITPIVDKIRKAIAGGMRNEKYFSWINREYTECIDEVWSVELSYLIKQYR